MLSEIAARPGGPAGQNFASLHQHCFTSIVVAAEIQFGAVRAPSSRRAARAMGALGELMVADFVSPADQHYGLIRAQLEKAGTPIGANDLFIAAHALALGATLVTANEREFRRVPGLAVENWAI